MVYAPEQTVRDIECFLEPMLRVNVFATSSNWTNLVAFGGRIHTRQTPTSTHVLAHSRPGVDDYLELASDRRDVKMLFFPWQPSGFFLGYLVEMSPFFVPCHLRISYGECTINAPAREEWS